MSVQVRVPAEGNVFVATYGSLRRGMQNFGVNRRGGGEFVAKGVSVENFNLYRYGGAYFPSVSLAHNSNGKPVVLDVFEAPMTGLTGAYDMLEGYPSFYNRTVIDVMLDTGELVKCFIYHIDEEQEELVESGDWCIHNIPDYYERLAEAESEADNS